ncbi:hypothetical protein KSP39_PZI009065 [Platanthera zijinensis]|uniref:Co-chaperone HscB C-terminal oligomerisation domain-containing protein n=1 Tax=Platanthera zijinensis TaxID=2320716 RepID=A0AAP0BKH0_9ASPA
MPPPFNTLDIVGRNGENRTTPYAVLIHLQYLVFNGQLKMNVDSAVGFYLIKKIYFNCFYLCNLRFTIFNESLHGFACVSQRLHPPKGNMLQLAGILVDEENTIGDPELLAEMMDVREAIEEASDQKTLKEIQSQIRRKHQEWSKSFKDAFDKRDFDFAIIATQRMRYYERAIEEIVKKL